MATSNESRGSFRRLSSRTPRARSRASSRITTGSCRPPSASSSPSEIAGRGLWEGVELTPTESHTRAYALLYEDERIEMWLLSWLPRHSTGFHDHGESNVGFCVAQGTLVEQQLRFAEPPHERTLVVGDARAAGSDYIHCLEWESGSPALSVHVYSPPLAVVGQYRSRGRRPPPRDPAGPRRAHQGLSRTTPVVAIG